MAGPLLRAAGPADAGLIAALHADSWRRHYRGAYSDAFLDGDVEADRRAFWTAHLAAPAGQATSPTAAATTTGSAAAGTATVVAEQDGRLVGFVHVVFDTDPRWGSLVGNLHVVHDRKRGGVGTRLLRHAARAVLAHGGGDAVHLWVLEQNTAAQQFYRTLGAACVESSFASAPGGDATRLIGTPAKLRMAWPDAAVLASAGSPARDGGAADGNRPADR